MSREGIIPDSWSVAALPLGQDQIWVKHMDGCAALIFSLAVSDTLPEPELDLSVLAQSYTEPLGSSALEN